MTHRPRLLPTRLHRIATIASGWLLFVCLWAPSALAVELEHWIADPNGRISSYRILDWHGDGSLDLVCTAQDVRADGGKARRLDKALLIYAIPAEGAGELTPGAVRELPAEVTGVVLFEPGGGRAPLLLGISKDSLLAISADPAEAPRVLHQGEASFFQFPGAQQVVEYPGVLDVNSDGLTDVLYPVVAGYRLLLQQAGEALSFKAGALLEAALPVAVEENEHNLLYFKSHLPTLTGVDADNDGRRDLINFTERKTLLFRGGADGAFTAWQSPEAAAAGKDEIRVTAEQILDIDGDGLNDRASALIFGSIGILESMKTKVQFTFGKPGVNLAEAPCQDVVLRKGVSIIPAFHDMDGDGDLDMLLSSVRTDLLSNAMAAFNDELDVHYYLFPLDRDTRRFDTSPSFEFKAVLKLGNLDPQKTIPVLRLDTDLDADGSKDMVRYDHTGRLYVHRGESSTPLRFHKDPDWTFHVQPEKRADIDEIWVHLQPIAPGPGCDILVFDSANHELHVLRRSRP